MAQITSADMEAALDSLIGQDAGTMRPVRVLKEEHDAVDYSRWYVEGNSNQVSDLAQVYGPRAMWVRTSVAGSAAVQAALVLQAMRLDSNVDPNAEV